MEVKVLPSEDSTPMWIRISMTREQIEGLGSGGLPLIFSGTAEFQYVSKHEVGNKSNVEIRIRDLSFRPDTE